MRINPRGQVTIPVEIRHRLGLVTGAEVDVRMSGNVIQLVPRGARWTRPTKAAIQEGLERMRSLAGSALFTTDEVLRMTRGED